MIQLVTDWRPLWPWVREGLWEVIERTRAKWLPEDVYTELRGGVAALFTIKDDAGFMVAKRLQDYDGQVFFVWALWGVNALADESDELHAAFAKVARDAGCVRMQMRSPRKGWARVGWRERETVYEMET